MRILFYDIETAPNLAYIWAEYEQDALEHVHEWYIMCVSWKWMGEKRVHVNALCDYEDYEKDPENDFNVVKKLWELIDEADVVIAHNGDKFDMRKANARFIWHGLGPPSPVKQIDTLKVARRYFMFNSNRLGRLGEHLKLGGKESTGGFQLWRRCMLGDPKAWKTMKAYAKQDTALLEKVYLAMRPWMKNHPSFNLLAGKPDACPVCAEQETLTKRGFRHTAVSTFQVWHCSSCGSYPSTRLAEPATKVKKPDFVSR